MADWVPGPLTVAVAALVAGLVVGSTAGTTATTPTVTDCTAITEPGEYELTANLTGTPDRACLRITAADVTVDGNGQTISGTDGTGVLVSASDGEPANVTVRDLRVRSWETGIAVRDVRSTTLANVTVTDTENGVVLTESTGLQVENVRTIDNGDGLLTRDVTDSLFRQVTVRDNDGTGFYTSDDFDGNRLVNTTARANSADGIRLGPAWNTTLRNTTASDNGGDGLALLDTGQIQMRNLTASENDGSGLALTAVSGARFQQVTARNNTVAAYSAVRSRNVTVRALSISPTGRLSVIAGSATIANVTGPPPAPDGYELAGPVIAVSNVEDGASRPAVTFSVRDPAATLWQHEHGRWVERTDGQYETGAGNLTATVGDGVFAPLSPR